MCPFPLLREKVLHRGWVVGVVQHQQPARILLQPAEDGLCDLGLFGRVLFRQVQQRSNLPKPAAHRLLGISKGPQHRCVFFPVSVGVLDGNLGFAYTTETGKGLLALCHEVGSKIA